MYDGPAEPANAATYPGGVTSETPGSAGPEQDGAPEASSAPEQGDRPADAPVGDPEGFGSRHSVLVYTLARIVLFAVVVGVLFLLGLRSYLLLAVAVLLSGAISLVMLNRARDAMSSSVSGTFRRINDKIDASTRAEDDDAPQA
jgi:hypothetical protein